jgi:hypothetical protein
MAGSVISGPASCPSPDAACTCPPLDSVSVSDSVACGGTGPVAGWCNGSATLTVNASDSAGHTVAISGTYGGTGFSCASTPCVVNLPEGSGGISYTGTCTGGLTDSGSDSYQLDATPPTVSGTLSGGTMGTGGYYNAGPVSLTCTGADSGGSGLYGITYGAQTATGDGSHTLSCTAEDGAGNTASYSTVVRIDSTPPSVSLLCNGAPCGTGWYTVPVTVTAGASDLTSGITPGSAEVSIDGGTTWSASAALPDGTTSAMARAFDVAGISNSASGTVRVDQVAPSATFLCNGSNCGSGWYNGPVTITLNATDATSGVVPASVLISTDGGATWVTTATLTTDGSHNVQGRALDVAGNTVNTSWVVQIDTVAPTVNGTLSGGVLGGGGLYQSGPVTLTCTANDPLSGVASITYGTQVATAPGNTVLDCTATDNAGNHASYTVSVFIDNSLPDAAFQYSGNYCAGGWYNSPVSISIAASDSLGSIASTGFAVDGVNWSSDRPVKDGVYSLTGFATDLAGNIRHLSDTLQVDTFPPLSSWITKADEWVGGEVSLEGQSIDWLSGIAKVEISFDDGRTWVAIGNSPNWSYAWNTKDLKVPDGPHTLLARALDNACNQEHTARVVVNVDNTPPDISLKDSLNIMGRSTTVNTFDAGSGVDHGLLTISGNGIEPVKIPFTADQTTVSWDGLTGDGKTAPFGIFSVVVDVWDKVGNHSSTRGSWVRPAPQVPTPIPTTKNSSAVIVSTPAASLPSSPIVISSQPAGLPFWLLTLPIGGMGVWLAASTVALSRDRRWNELRKLSRSVNQYLSQSKTNSQGGEDND